MSKKSTIAELRGTLKANPAFSVEEKTFAINYGGADLEDKDVLEKCGIVDHAQVMLRITG